MDTRAIINDLLAVIPDFLSEFDGLSDATETDLELWLPTIPTSAGLVAIIEKEVSRRDAVALARRAGAAVADKEVRKRALEMWLERRGAPPTEPLLCAQRLAKHVVETSLQGSATPDSAYGISKSLAPETERVARAIARYYLDTCTSASEKVSFLEQVMNPQLMVRLRRAFEQLETDGDVDGVLEKISFGTIGSLVKVLLLQISSNSETGEEEDVEISQSAVRFEQLASLRNPVLHGRGTSEQGHPFCEMVSNSLGTWLRRRLIPRGALVIEVKLGQFGILVTAEDEHGKDIELSGLARDTLSAGDSLLIEPNPDRSRLNGAGLRPLPRSGTWISPNNDVTSDLFGSG